MAEVLLDSSTYIDLEKANKHRPQPWATATLRHAILYRKSHGEPFLSAITVVEIVRGLHRNINPVKAALFQQEVANDFRLLEFDIPTSFLAGEIVARLETQRKGIGVPDCLIAAVAIHKGLTLVTANTNHFQRVVDAGYPLQLGNWREP